MGGFPQQKAEGDDVQPDGHEKEFAVVLETGDAAHHPDEPPPVAHHGLPMGVGLQRVHQVLAVVGLGLFHQTLHHLLVNAHLLIAEFNHLLRRQGTAAALGGLGGHGSSG